jgi:hypothetical protein
MLPMGYIENQIYDEIKVRDSARVTKGLRKSALLQLSVSEFLDAD